jgi:phosphotransferase system HPr (HPr) family protein
VPTVERTVRVANRQGVHARPAQLFVHVANGFASEISVRVGASAEVDGKSILGMLTLAAVHGSELTIRARGRDAADAVGALEGLVRAGFGED